MPWTATEWDIRLAFSRWAQGHRCRGGYCGPEDGCDLFEEEYERMRHRLLNVRYRGINDYEPKEGR